MSTFVYLTAAVPASGENHPARGHPRPRPGTDDFRSVARRTPTPMPPARHCARSEAEHSTERVGRGGAASDWPEPYAPRRPDDRPDGAGNVSAVPLGERSDHKARGHVARRGAGSGTPAGTGNEASPLGSSCPIGPAPQGQRRTGRDVRRGDRRAVFRGCASALPVPAGRSPEAPTLVPSARWHPAPFNRFFLGNWTAYKAPAPTLDVGRPGRSGRVNRRTCRRGLIRPRLSLPEAVRARPTFRP